LHAEHHHDRAYQVTEITENGVELSALVEERAPNGFKELSDVITRQELEEIADEYKRIGGFDVERLNNRTSLSASSPLPRASTTGPTVED